MTDDAPAARLPYWARLAALALATLVAVFAIGAIIGFTKAWIDEGDQPSARGLLIYAGFWLAAGLSGWAAWRLSAHWRRPGRSAYQRRYTNMWLTLIALGFPLGLLLGIVNTSSGGGLDDLFGSDPIPPTLAALVAGSLAVLLVASLVLYHRVIDDHEQQAYLWANSLSFYFLVIAIPVAWLLARGGILPAFGPGGAMLIVLAAILINAATWCWLKFR